MLLGAALGAREAYRLGWLRFNYPSIERYPVRGIDVSHHQGEIDWDALSGENLRFAFLKATEGADHADREYERNRDGARRAGIAYGSYHFFTFCTPGADQAEHFLARIGARPGALPPVADVEFSGNCRNWASLDAIRRELDVFLRRVEQVGGRRPLLYVTDDAVERILDGRFDGYALWRRDVFFRPAQDDWLFWQYAHNARLAGIRGPVDLNVFHADPDAFRILLDPEGGGS